MTQMIGDWRIRDDEAAVLEQRRGRYRVDVDVDAEGNLNVDIEQGGGHERECLTAIVPAAVLQALGYTRATPQGR